MTQKITQMRLARYLFTAVLALLFVNCSKGRSSDEPKPSIQGEQTTSSNQAEYEISSNDYELSADGLTLIKWHNHNTKNLDMNRDTRLRKVKEIGNNAFERLDLTSITISSSITSIGERAFLNCRSLTSINIPTSVTAIGTAAFAYCIGLTSINIPSSVTSIGERAFFDCRSLTSINIPSSVTAIRTAAFASCTGLTSITIPSSVTSIESGTFADCTGLTSIHIPRSVTSIGDIAFEDCTSLTSINIPSSVTSIGIYAFASCGSLTSINIPNSVTSIGDYAFNECNRLTRVIFKGNNPPKISDSDHMFWRTPNNLKFIIPKGAKSAYIEAGYPKDKLIEE